MKWASNSHHPSSDFSTATNLLHSWLVGLGVWFSLWVREVPGSNPGRAQSFGLKNKKEHIQHNSCHFDKLPLFPKKNVPWPGFEPGLLRPQRKVLTTILSRQLLEGYQNAEANTNFIFFFPKIRKKASPAGNRTPVFRVTGGDTHHYTTEDVAISKSKFTS